MKYLKSFNESGTLRTFYRLQKSDIQEILDIFTELVDEGFDLINKNEQEQLQFYNPDSGEITYQLATDELDDKGLNRYKSPYTTGGRGHRMQYDNSDSDREILRKYFRYYQQIIFNVNIGSNDKDKMINICSGIYDRLISSGYNCQLWEPGYQKFRFHISTPESNPFMVSKNSLKSE